ncbi:hypothetical protein FR483_n610L [Paramecium bursaria Chlorella virus FR483]|uniref:Uncharacterized protein n610L n=1 Tax=Paramecium bursaria Chlorella virus FR483 TaxID=399781 RepID=A7J7W4_PBCVF|nr:hypothetical protein FR483_n610L [Paramecium bursaria Chlorella virus FR483]ABT15895.1 hypothetical protein FR483_n610L [Paramecium bursaria Chlorella virus FR483]
MQKMFCQVIAWGGAGSILSLASMERHCCVTSWRSRHFTLSCGPQRSRKRLFAMRMMTRRTSGLINSDSAPLLTMAKTHTITASAMARRPCGRSVRHTSTACSKKMIISALQMPLSILKPKDILKHLIRI